jgi:hypothetical protein
MPLLVKEGTILHVLIALQIVHQAHFQLKMQIGEYMTSLS